MRNLNQTIISYQRLSALDYMSARKCVKLKAYEWAKFYQRRAAERSLAARQLMGIE
jgi:hypothetical protein